LQIIKTVDTTPPYFTKSPVNRHLSCNPSPIPDCDTSSANIIATDNCGTPNIVCAKSDSVSGDGCFHDRTLTYTAFDSCGLASTNCVQHIFWTTDTTPPTFILCPTDMDLGLNPASVPDCDLSSSNVEAEDGCSSPVIHCMHVDATNGCQRTRTIIYTATDACNNVGYCNQVITWRSLDTPPILTVAQDGSNVVISWPATCIDFHLEQTSSLNPTLWSNVSQPVVVVGDMRTVTIPIANDTFYRLKSP